MSNLNKFNSAGLRASSMNYFTICMLLKLWKVSQLFFLNTLRVYNQNHIANTVQSLILRGVRAIMVKTCKLECLLRLLGIGGGYLPSTIGTW